MKKSINKSANPTLETLTHDNIESLLCHEDRDRNRKPWAYRMVERGARFSGSLTFLFANFLLFAVWIGVNLTPRAFDPYPFIFLTLVVSLEAIALSILILIGQNMSSEENERRHHLDLQINLLGEREMTALMRLTLKMAVALDIPPADRAEVSALAEDTEPVEVLDQIVAAEAMHKR